MHYQVGHLCNAHTFGEKWHYIFVWCFVGMMSTSCSSWRMKLPIRPSTEPAMVNYCSPTDARLSCHRAHGKDVARAVREARARAAAAREAKRMRGRPQRGRRGQRRERRAAQAAAARARRAAAAREALVARAAPSSSPGSDRPGGPDLLCSPTGWTASLHPPPPPCPHSILR